ADRRESKLDVRASVSRDQRRRDMARRLGALVAARGARGLGVRRKAFHGRRQILGRGERHPALHLSQRRLVDVARPLVAITIRPATPADLPALGRLGALLVRAHHDFDAKRFIPATSETEGGYSWFLGTQLEKPTICVLVAEDGGEVIGYTYAGVEGRDYMSL